MAKPNSNEREVLKISISKKAVDRFKKAGHSDKQTLELLGQMLDDTIVKSRAEREKEDRESFKGDFLSTTAAIAIIRLYGRVVDKRGSKVIKRLDCDLFQAAARHTGLIDEMPRYYGASGKHMVAIPSLLKASHGLIRWDWDYEGECQICPEKNLCYDEREAD